MHPHLQLLIECLDLEEKETADRYRLDQQHSLRQLKAEGLALHPISVMKKSFGYLDYPEISFRLPFPVESSRFRDGAAIEFFITGEEPVKGMLLELDGNKGGFRLFAPDFPDWAEDDGTGIKLAPDTRSTDILKRSLRSLEKDKENEKLFLQLHKEEPVPEPAIIRTSTIHYRNEQLNDSQRSAVSSMVDNQRLTIIHGPPGTGKTTTLVEGIRQLTEDGRKVMVSAPSNAAVDNIAQELLKAGIRLLRVGNTGKVDPSVFPHTPEGRMAGSREQKDMKQLRIRAEEFRRMAMKYKRNFGRDEREQRNLLLREVKSIRGEIRKIQAYHEEKLFAEAQVVAGTPIGLQDSLPGNTRFDTIVMDEAGQCMEPFAWCLFPHAERIVLAGDHWQLPPTVISQEAAKKGLAVSILERAIESGYPLTLLNTQYRMRMSIAGFSSGWFYNNLLQTASHLHDQGIHLTFIDTAGSGFNEECGSDGTSMQNEGELRIVKQLAEQEALPAAETAFISPYAGQVAAAKATLGDGYRISTIDSFQGQEMKHVIVSLVRSNEDGIIGFLKDYRRMNVALTRAKERLYVIGDSATIGADPFYIAFLEYVEKKGDYRTVWEFET
jgi:superfamily I DNA and/or RNA helicase